MKTFVRMIAATVRAVPWLVVAATVGITAWLGSFAPDRTQASVVDSFAPDSPEFLTFEQIGEDFGGTTTTVQVVMLSPDGDMITRAGLAAQVAIEAAVMQSDASRYLDATAPDGAILGVFTPLLRLLPDGVGPEDLADDDAVKSAFTRALAVAGPDVTARVLEGLAVDGTDLALPESPAGLVVVELVFPDTLAEEDVDVLLAGLEAALLPVGNDEIGVQVFAGALLNASEAIRSQINRLMLQAAVIIVVILGFVMWVGAGGDLGRRRALQRTASDVAIAAATTALSLIWVLGAEAGLGPDHLGLIGYSSSITQVVPVLLIGLGVDYAIHLTARYREELAAGHGVRSASGRAIGAVGVALALGAATTAVGFLTNVANPVPTLQDFGILAAVGIGGAFVLMLTFAPAVRTLLDRRAERRGTLPVAAMRRRGGGVVGAMAAGAARPARRFPRTVVGVALLAAALGGFGLTRLDTSFSLVDFVPDGTQALEASRTLDRRFAGGLGETTYVHISGDPATVPVHNALVGALADLALLPDVVPLDGGADAESPVAVLAAVRDADPVFAAAATAAGLRADLTFAPGGHPGAVYRDAALLAPDAMGRVFAGSSAVVRVTTQAGEERVGALREAIEAAFEPVEAVPQVTTQVTSTPIIVEEVKRALSTSQVASLSITLAAAMMLLVVGFWWEARRPFLGVITIVPVALVVLWTYGMMASVGIPFSPSTAMVAALAIGIGVDYTIHIVRRYLEDRSRFATLAEAVLSTARSTGGALTGSALTTLAGFGVLITSTLGPFRDLGAVVVFAIGFSLIAAVVMLPAMLVLWDRWHTVRGRVAVGDVRGTVTAYRDGGASVTPRSG